MKLPLPWPFDTEYMQLALAAGLVVGVCAPLIGAFLVQKRLALMGDGIGHLAFSGVAAGTLAGVAPLGVALVVSAVGAVAIERLRGRGRASGDLVLALFFYSGIAAGVVLLSRAGSLNSSVAYLFGRILTISPSELWLVVALGLAIVISMAVMGRALFAVVLDEESARVAGLPVDALNSALAVLTAVAVVAAMQVVGVLLIAALMVMPVASAQAVSRSFRATVAWAVAFGAGSVVIGLVAARAWDLAAGATIVLVAGAAYAVTAAALTRVRARHGGLESGRGPGLTSAS
jgi:zinc transport system permease protein